MGAHIFTKIKNTDRYTKKNFFSVKLFLKILTCHDAFLQEMLNVL